ncbi:MAG: transglutaminase domain-containing protein [Pirellulales bacterium]|nr:transglutaminase domain-containing protein [Pirellulales bacterium]
MKASSAVLCACLLLVSSALPARDAADPSLAEVYQEAIRLEDSRELTRAKGRYEEILARCDPQRDWLLRRNAQQGLLRVDDLRAEFAMSETQLREKLAQTYRDYRAEEFADWQRRGWILSKEVDGVRGYSILNPTNLGFFDSGLMARNANAVEGYRQFARIFLDESAALDRLRSSASGPQTYVAPVRHVYSVRAVVRRSDLPPGPVVRAWFPYPLLTPAVQSIRLVSVEPPGALKSSPDIASEIGIAYLEAPRPEKDDLTLELKVAFDAYHTDFQIDPDTIESYDRRSELYQRFTRSEQQIALTEPLCELARTVVGGEENPYRKARKLYDWVCDNVKYNFVWRWRDATFTYGCASEEVRSRRIGDCVIQSVFYAALCRSAGIPARVVNGPIFPPGMKNDHVWAEIYFPRYGWMPVDVTYSEVAGMVPGLSESERRTIRDFFFGRMDRWRLCTQRSELAQELVPVKKSRRRHVTMFVRPELECGGQDVESRTLSWECTPQ